MNDSDLKTNDIPRDERQPKAAERPPREESIAELRTHDLVDSRPSKSWFWLTGAIIVGFWVFQYISLTLRGYLSEMANTPWASLLVPRAVVSGVSLIVSFALPFLIIRIRHLSMFQQALVVVLSAVVLTVAVSIVNTATFLHLAPSGDDEWLWESVLTDSLWRIWTFLTVAVVVLAMSYAAMVREREQRISALQQLAHSAQLRALRNQLSPHFLFNALNSIVALITTRRAPEAETMTENLADFLRMTLALDPQQLITLEEELRLQNLYLAIEQVRFPGRLEVALDVPDDLKLALVPSLITQPLIENTIKYGVARSTRPVALSISARRAGGQLELIVADSGGDAEPAPAKSASLGLLNVAERMRMHYGEAGALIAGPDSAGGFRNRLTAPLQFAQ